MSERSNVLKKISLDTNHSSIIHTAKINYRKEELYSQKQAALFSRSQLRSKHHDASRYQAKLVEYHTHQLTSLISNLRLCSKGKAKNKPNGKLNVKTKSNIEDNFCRNRDSESTNDQSLINEDVEKCYKQTAFKNRDKYYSSNTLPINLNIFYNLETKKHLDNNSNHFTTDIETEINQCKLTSDSVCENMTSYNCKLSPQPATTADETEERQKHKTVQDSVVKLDYPEMTNVEQTQPTVKHHRKRYKHEAGESKKVMKKKCRQKREKITIDKSTKNNPTKNTARKRRPRKKSDKNLGYLYNTVSHALRQQMWVGHPAMIQSIRRPLLTPTEKHLHQFLENYKPLFEHAIQGNCLSEEKAVYTPPYPVHFNTIRKSWRDSNSGRIRKHSSYAHSDYKDKIRPKSAPSFSVK